MSIELIQGLINNGEWDQLVKTNVLPLISDFKDIVITRDFIIDFVANQRIIDSINYCELVGIKFSIINFFLNLNQLIYTSNVNMSPDDWEFFLINIISLHSKNNRIALENIVTTQYKDANFVRALLNDNVFNKLTESIGGSMSSSSSINMIDEHLIRGLTEKELLEFGPRISYNNKIPFSAKDPSIFLKLFDSPLSTIAFLEESENKGNIFLDGGDVIKNFSEAEFYNLWDEVVKKLGLFVAQYNLLGYFKHNKDVPVKDEILKEFTSFSPTSEWDNIIPNMTDEQIKEHIEDIPESSLASIRDMNLSKLNEYFNNDGGLRDFSKLGVFKEDDIKNNPNLLDPKSLSIKVTQYITPETFKIINKTWNKRTRYNDFLTNFEAITSNINPKFFTVENLKYLAKATNAKNSVIVKAISLSTGKVGDKIRSIRDFLNFFGNV